VLSLTSLIPPRNFSRALTSDLALADGSRQATRSAFAPLLWIAGAIALALVIVLRGHQFVHAIDSPLRANWKLVAAGSFLEAASIAGYVVLLHHVVARAHPRLRLKDSYRITLAGTAATRLLPTAGLGGAAVTIWALRARGVRPTDLTERFLAFLLLLYGVYLGALLVCGAAVGLGVFHVTHGRALGAVGALLAVTIAAAVLSLLAAPSLLAGALRRAANRAGRVGAAADRAEQHLPALRTALRRAWLEARRPHPALLGAVAWWGFDIGVLVAMLHALGAAPPVPAVVLAYFLGTMFNVLPLPGSLSGGLASILIVLGTPAVAAIAAVLAYRAVAVWLPAASGIASLTRLRATVAAWRAETVMSPAGLRCDR
jgi:uncharacterized membrane protein YbhN (UPF0104 family)